MIPILSRLELRDYFRLAYALSILIIDRVLRFVWPVIYFFKPRKSEHDSLKEEKDKFMGLKDTRTMLMHFGVDFEEVVVRTEDGFFLTLFRMLPTTNESPSISGNSANSSNTSKPPVLMLHGSMLSSDVWFCHREPLKNLPILLLRLGHEVWLGNRRGNKYSSRHMHLKSRQPEFWDWGLDEVALFDIPSMVQRVVDSGKNIKGTKCVVIAFSQGSAEIMAALSLDKELNEKVGLVIGLATMTRPNLLSSPSIMSALIHGPPELLYLLFGRKMMLSSVLFWMEKLPSRVYSALIDFFMGQLFGWDCRNIDKVDRRHMYLKLYSYCSVKTVAHWFQMARAGRFQMFDDNEPSTGHVPIAYPLKQIRSPLVLFFGERDSLCDHKYTMDELADKAGGPVEHVIQADYEHIDFIMADNVDTALFPRIEKILARCRTQVTVNGAPRSRSRKTSDNSSFSSLIE